MPLPEKGYFSLGELAVRWKCSESDLSDFVHTGRLAAAVISPTGENLGTFIELRERKRIASAPSSGGVLLWARAIGEESYLMCDLRIAVEERDRFECEHGLEALAILFERGTLEEAASAVARQHGWHNGARDTLLKWMVEAVKDGRLIVRDPHTDLHYRPEVVRVFCELVTREDLNTCFQQAGVPYRLAKVGGVDEQAGGELPTEDSCITCPPKKPDSWYDVIRVAAKEFFRAHSRCPTGLELWAQLRESPPTTYGVTSTTDKGGEEAVGMGVESLAKNALLRRWKRYTTAPVLSPADQKEPKSTKIDQ